MHPDQEPCTSAVIFDQSSTTGAKIGTVVDPRASITKRPVCIAREVPAVVAAVGPSLIPQKHGGALLSGGKPGNPGPATLPSPASGGVSAVFAAPLAPPEASRVGAPAGRRVAGAAAWRRKRGAR